MGKSTISTGPFSIVIHLDPTKDPTIGKSSSGSRVPFLSCGSWKNQLFCHQIWMTNDINNPGRFMQDGQTVKKKHWIFMDFDYA